jgi:hypothetical protein
VSRHGPGQDRCVGTLGTHISSALSTGQGVVPADLRTALSMNITNAHPSDVLVMPAGGFGGAGVAGAGLAEYGHRPDLHSRHVERLRTSSPGPCPRGRGS